MRFAGQLGVVIVLAALTAVLAGHPVFSSDGLWQLKLGQVISEQGQIPRVDTFSAVHPERPWVQFQWLWQWAFYQLWRAVGWTGMRTVQALLMASSVVLAHEVARRRLRDPGLAAAFGATLLLLIADRFRLRPDAFNLLFTYALLPVWLGGFRSLSPRGMLGLFALCCLWSNLHTGASLLALASAGAVWTGALSDRKLRPELPSQVRAASIALGLCTLGLLASPIFLPGMAHFLGIYRFMVDTGNPEWAPTITLVREGLSPGTALVAAAPSVATIAYGVRCWRKVRDGGRLALDTGEVLLCAGYLLLAHHAIRNVYLCSVPLLLSLQHVSPPRRAGLSWALAAALLAVVVDQHGRRAYGDLETFQQTYAHDMVPATFPRELTAFMREAQIEGPILNHGPWAGWLIWSRYPHSRVFLDTRYNVTPAMYDLYQRASQPATRLQAMDEAFERHGIELAVYPGPISPVVTPAHWVRLMKMGDQELYQHRRGAHAEQNLKRRDAWLADQGSAGQSAAEAGGARWLQSPWQRFRLQRWRRQLAQGQPAEQASAARKLAGLWWRAERCDAALELYARAAASAPLTAVSMLRSADCLRRQGNLPRTSALLQQVDPRRLGAADRLLFDRLVAASAAPPSP